MFFKKKKVYNDYDWGVCQWFESCIVWRFKVDLYKNNDSE